MIKNTGLILLLIIIFSGCILARTDRYRVMWRTDPATSLVIGWDQISGNNPTVYYGVIDNGREIERYANTKKADQVIQAKGMNNHFARLSNLRPNTVYYFVIKDSEGVSKRMSFQTLPNNTSARLSIVAGGDSRNHRMARQKANHLVSLLRPHCILFSGDMTTSDQASEWIEWFDDWQYTMSKDGRLYPIVVARGNHEADNKGLNQLFDVGKPSMYYSLTLGGSLLKVLTLNTMIPSSGTQREWLAKELVNSSDITWKIAQYHHAMRPHNSTKKERNDLILHWATLFHKYGVDVAVESDAHCVKWTYPIRPNRAPGSDEGFIRDDVNGTVYIGEGGWGAPLRSSDDKKKWTRDSESFNQFKWIFVSEKEIQIRTLKTDCADEVVAVDDDRRFEVGSFQSIIWKPANGSVITIKNPNFIEKTRLPSYRPPNNPSIEQPTALPTVLKPDPTTKQLYLEYNLKQRCDVEIILINNQMKAVARFELKDQRPGLYEQSIDFSKIRSGKYQLVIKGAGGVIEKFNVEL